jgi:micrococcal nuclease
MIPDCCRPNRKSGLESWLKYFLFLAVLIPVAVPVFASDFYRCVDIVDGDTIAVEMEHKRVKVKLIGIGNPEAIDSINRFEFIGKECVKSLKSVVLGKKVRLEYDSVKIDDAGRVLAYVYIEDSQTSVNEDLIKKGYAFVYSKYQFKNREKFRRLQEDAKANAVGLWRLDYDNSLFDHYRLTLDTWHFWLYALNVVILLIGLIGTAFAVIQIRRNRQAQAHAAFLESEKEFYHLDKLMLQHPALREFYRMGDEYLEKASDEILQKYIFYELYYGHLCRTYVTLHSRRFRISKRFAEEYWPLYENMLDYLLEDETFREVHYWSRTYGLFEKEFMNEVDRLLKNKKNVCENKANVGSSAEG